MASEKLLEVYKALREAQTKYTYFLLAASGAAIALAVNKTHEAALAWTQLPLAAAVLSWGLSFFFGCRHLAYVASTLYDNGFLLQVESGEDRELGWDRETRQMASEELRNAIDRNVERATALGQHQFRYLIAGAVLFVAWHVLEMYLRGANGPRLL